MKYMKGDLLDLAEKGEFNIIVHGCNCQCTMGSGIAKQIRERYPKAYLVDQMTEKGDVGKLGKFTQAYVTGYPTLGGSGRYSPYHFTLINAYTQFNYGRGGMKYVSYDALESVFKQIKLLYDMNTQAHLRIGIPKIGAGLAGGDWDVIEKIIDDIGLSDITCVEYEEK